MCQLGGSSPSPLLDFIPHFPLRKAHFSSLFAIFGGLLKRTKEASDISNNNQGLSIVLTWTHFGICWHSNLQGIRVRISQDLLYKTVSLFFPSLKILSLTRPPTILTCTSKFLLYPLYTKEERG